MDGVTSILLSPGILEKEGEKYPRPTKHSRLEGKMKNNK